MGVEIEIQTHEEVAQLRTREIQQENTQKLEQIIPTVEAIDSVDLPTIEQNTNQIKNMVFNNIDQQTDLDEIADMLNTISKGIVEIKKSNTRITNAIKKNTERIDELYKKYGELDG